MKKIIDLLRAAKKHRQRRVNSQKNPRRLKRFLPKSQINRTIYHRINLRKMLANKNKSWVETSHLMRLNNSSLRLNSAKITLNRTNPNKTKIASSKARKGINLSKEMTTSNSIRIEINRIERRDIIEILSKVMRIWPLKKQKIIGTMVTISLIENHTIKTGTMVTGMGINKIIKDVQDNKITRTSTIRNLIEDTQKKRTPIHREPTSIEEEIKEPTTTRIETTIRIEIAIRIEMAIRIETMNKDQTQEKTRDSITIEDPIETINKMKTQQEVPKNIKRKSMKPQGTNASRRKITNPTHL